MALRDLLAPPACLVCRAPPPPGAQLCRACAAGLPWIVDACPRCALPPGRWGGCPPCPAATAAFTSAYAPLAHAGPARDVVLALKLRKALPAADLMAEHIVERAPPGLLDDERVVLVPVPGDARRQRERGFDPAARLAAAVARLSGRTVVEALRRRTTSPRQLGRSRVERRRGAAFEPALPPPQGAIPVLIDDVHTTGATLDGCARALRTGGSSRIAAVTYVRTFTTA